MQKITSILPRYIRLQNILHPPYLTPPQTTQHLSSIPQPTPAPPFQPSVAIYHLTTHNIAANPKPKTTRPSIRTPESLVALFAPLVVVAATLALPLPLPLPPAACCVFVKGFCAPPNPFAARDVVAGAAPLPEEPAELDAAEDDPPAPVETAATVRVVLAAVTVFELPIPTHQHSLRQKTRKSQKRGLSSESIPFPFCSGQRHFTKINDITSPPPICLPTPKTGTELKQKSNSPPGLAGPNVASAVGAFFWPEYVRATAIIVVTSLQKSAAEETSVKVYLAQAGSEASVLLGGGRFVSPPLVEP